VIDGGYGKLKGKTFRISNMGDETDETIAALLKSLDAALAETPKLWLEILRARGLTARPHMKSLIIAEKPSVAADLARALGKVPKKGEHLRERRVRHLLGRRPPRGTRDAGGHRQEEIRLLAAGDAADHPGEIRLKPIEESKDRFDQLKKLLARKDVDQVINACDAGREGELIFTYLYQLAKCKLPVKRAWMQTMTTEGIREAFKHLRDGEQMAGPGRRRPLPQRERLAHRHQRHPRAHQAHVRLARRQRRLRRPRADPHPRHRLQPRAGDPQFQAARRTGGHGHVRSRQGPLRGRLPAPEFQEGGGRRARPHRPHLGPGARRGRLAACQGPAARRVTEEKKAARRPRRASTT
jgi:hypothetical protein